MYVLISPFAYGSIQGRFCLYFLGFLRKKGGLTQEKETALLFLIDICADAASKQASLWVCVF